MSLVSRSTCANPARSRLLDGFAYRNFVEHSTDKPARSRFHVNATSSHRAVPRVPDLSTSQITNTGQQRLQPRQDDALFNLIALALGAILGLIHVPFPASWLLPIPLALVMLLILEQPSAKDSSRVGFFAGLGFWAIHLFWLPQSFAGVFPSAAVLVWLLMPLVWVIEAGFWAFTVWVSVRITPYYWARLGVLCSGFVILEWLRSLGPLAFPWGNFGYALIDTPLAQVAAFGGVYLESVLILLMAAGIVGLLRRDREWRVLALACGLWAAGLLWGLTQLNPPPATAPVLLVQPNISPLEKARNGLKDLETFKKLSQNAPPGALVIWPEAAVNLSDALKSGLVNPLVTGAYEWINVAGRPQPKNIVALVKYGKLEDKSVKTKHVPFGEAFPFRYQLAFIYDPIFNMLGIPGEGTAAEGGAISNLHLPGRVIGAFVCYDSIFPEVPSVFTRSGAQVLVLPTNDAWFGGGIGNSQHFAMDRMRAIEQDRYFLRSANTGITAIIDARGRVVTRLPQNQASALEGLYAPLDTKTLWVQFGDLFMFLWIAIGVLFAIWGHSAQRAQAERAAYYGPYGSYGPATEEFEV
jgi:apolipoprotein N-acyltransferase